MPVIEVRAHALVLLIGPSSAGKSSFAAKHFLPTEVISSDRCRALLCDDENNQDVNEEAFQLVHFLVRKRLALGKFTVVDATNLERTARRALRAIAKGEHAQQIAICLNLPLAELRKRHQMRPDRDFDEEILLKQHQSFQGVAKQLANEGFREVHMLSGIDEINDVTIVRTPLSPWRHNDDNGPFDIIGDIHGCFDELYALLEKLGYQVTQIENRYQMTHPENRKVIFVGDIIDRGPNTIDCLKLVMDTVEQGQSICLRGNHEEKLIRWLEGKKPNLTHGFETTVAEFEHADDNFKARVLAFLNELDHHYLFDNGKLVVAHAGLPESFHGKHSGAVWSMALFGKNKGTNEQGLPIREDWGSEYTGKAKVVYGHVPVPEATWNNNTICIDTGCAFGGSLTALRYPEEELCSVPAKQTYYHHKSISPEQT